MGKITLDIPDSIQSRAIDATVYLNGYTDEVRDPKHPELLIPNPILKDDFFIDVIMSLIKSNMISYESKDAVDSAVSSLKQEVETAVPSLKLDVVADVVEESAELDKN